MNTSPLRTASDLDRDFLKTLTLLYVEDDDETRQQMANLLRRRVRVLTLASNGEQGLSSFLHSRPDLVLTDIQMPAMEGLTMSQRIRALDKQIPILVTTAFEQSDYFIRSIEIGVDRFVVKPVEFERLEAALLECAHRLRLEAELTRRGRLEDELHRHQSMATFADGVAQDYSEILTSVLQDIAQARAALPPDSPAAAALDAAKAHAEEAGHLGDALRQLGDGRLLPTSPQPLRPLLTEAVQHAVQGASRSAQAVRDSLAFSEGVSADIAVVGDARQLTAMFSEIASNAVEAMPDGGALEVTVSLVTLRDRELPLAAGQYVDIAWRDSGTGMSNDVAVRAFDAYFTTKFRSGQRGTGLGLALARSVARRHRGLVMLSPDPQRGGDVQPVTLHVYLPVVSA